MSLRVPSPGLLRVSCPQRLNLKEILSFIEEKKDFIEARELEWRKILSKASIQRFENGELSPFLGTQRELVIHQHTGRERALLKSSQIHVYVNELRPCSVQGALIRFYKKSGRNYLSHLLKIQSKRMDLYPKAVSFRSQRTRWGSCTSQGKISLNWRLVAAPSEVAEYVVIHELAHLRHQDHSKDFWRLVEDYSPYFRNHKKWLKEHQIQFEFLDPNYMSVFP